MKTTTKMVRVEVASTHVSPYGAVAEIIPGKSIRIIGWKLVDGAHSAINRDLKFLQMYAVGVEADAVRRDYLMERGLLVLSFDRTFVIGDEIEYDSYNLSYTNAILSITAQSVMCQNHGRGRKRMKLSEFVWRNHDFNAAETARQNSETMNYI